MKLHVFNCKQTSIIILFFFLIFIRYDEELVIPIIENTPEEKDLKVH